MINKKNIWIGALIILTSLALPIIQSCKKEKLKSPWSLPTVTTEVIEVTETSVLVSGNITSNGGIAVNVSGICWGTSENPTIEDNKTINGPDSGLFVSEIKGLTSNTTYYVRAYATNIEGTGYGSSVSFTTKGLAKVTTADITNVTLISAVGGGSVTNAGGSAITARGVCWSTQNNPTLNDAKTIDSSGLGVFISNLTNLTDGSTYYVRAYATNATGTSYGNEVQFTTTSAAEPIVNTTTVTNVTQISANCGGTITSDGGASITAKGVCWSTSPNPTTSNSKLNFGSGTGSFTGNLTGLTAATTYYVRAYATNKVGTSYGIEQQFTTLSPTLPVLTTTAASSITQIKANSGGTIISDGASAITEKGVCWSTNPGPTTANKKTIDGNGTGAFTSNLTGLLAGVTYYVRAYAKNALGTAYGNEIQFRTLSPILPTCSTAAVTNILTTTATGGGVITDTGFARITDKGICWSTSSGPTTANSKVSNGSGPATFISNITGLSGGAVRYYVRAYAVNSAGTAYGNEVTFTTPPTTPTLTTTAISNITNTTASSGGNISSDGGSAITARGICWSTSSGPTTSNSRTVNGTGLGAFSSNLNFLASGVTYYVRAYATNAIGTSYGNEISFTTSVNIGQSYNGGKVAYILQSGDAGYDPNVQHGLIVTNSDLSGGIIWNNGSSTTGATGSKIGDGSSNTTKIVTVQGNPKSSYAAGLADNHIDGIYFDWYLPSSDELQKIYTNRVSIGMGSTGFYWSSTETSSSDARYINFTNGNNTSGTKTSSMRVRAIRKF
jgi:hypothetical protein